MGLSAHLPIRVSLNIRFSRELKEPAFAPREAIAGKDARTLAREMLAMSDEDFRTAFNDSPMKRAKLRGLKQNAAVVLGNVVARRMSSDLQKRLLRIACA